MEDFARLRIIWQPVSRPKCGRLPVAAGRRAEPAKSISLVHRPWMVPFASCGSPVQNISVTATSPGLTVMASQHAAPSVAPTGGVFLARICDDALYGLWPLRDYCCASRLRGLLELPQLLAG